MAEAVSKYEHRGETALRAAMRAGFALWEQDGVWVTRDGQGRAAADFLTAYDPLPDERADALARLAEYRWRTEEGGVRVGNVDMDSARDARANLIGAVVGAQMALATGQAMKTVWKDKAGRATDVDAQTMISLGLAVHGFVAACFAREAELAAEIEAETDWRALAAFDPSARWGK